jgi:hypothetical protein
VTVVPFDPSKKKPKTNGEAKAKQDWQNASLDKAKFRLEHQAIEERARKVVAKFGVVCATLKEMKPEVDAIKEFFNARPRNTVEVLGCKSFRDFCLDRLHRNESTVYKMLRGDEKKEKEPKKRVPKKREREEDHIPREAVVRMRQAIDKVNEARNAKSKDEADAAWKEYDEIAAAQPLVSTINGGSEEPDYRRLTATLLTAGLYMLQAMQNVLDSGVLDKGSALEMSVKAALDKGNETFLANARRLGVLPPTVQ